MSSSEDNSDLDEFTEFLEEVASEIKSKKFKALKRLCKNKIPASDLCSMEDPGDLLDTLRDDDVISPTNTTFLVKMLKNKNVRMKTLADKVKKFTDLYNKKLGHTTKATTNDTSSMVGSKRKRSPDNLFGQSAQQKKKSTGRKGIVSREPGPRDTQGDSAVTAHITRAHTSVLSSKQSDTRIKRTRSADATNVSESKRKQDTDKEIPAFTKILKEISDDLCSYEVEEMKSLLIGKQLSRKDEHKIKTGMNLFLYLQSTGKISCTNFGLLRQLLKRIHRQPLVEKLQYCYH